MTKHLASRIKDRREAERVHDRRATELGRQADVAVFEVEDPYGLDKNDRIVVLRQLRGDPLARLHAHRQIDDAEYYAGRAYQRDWEIAERGARAIDPTREAVDGGELAEPLTDGQQDARKRLIQIHRLLGRHMTAIVQAVLIGGTTVEWLADKGFERPGQTWTRYYGAMLRDALDMLAVEYGLQDRKTGKRYVAVQQISS